MSEPIDLAQAGIEVTTTAHLASPSLLGEFTNVPGVTDVQALRIGGNGVVPRQAAAAARMWLAHHRQGDAA